MRKMAAIVVTTQAATITASHHQSNAKSLPAGVFKPYSGVKTSILFLDKKLARKIDKVLFVKVNADGFDLGDQRRAIPENDLPEAERIVKTWLRQELNDQFVSTLAWKHIERRFLLADV